jgi:hypothetical protein
VLKQDDNASVILSNLLKNLEELYEAQSSDFILKSDIEQLIKRYKTQFDYSNTEEKLECLRLNSNTLDNLNGSFEEMESFSNISSHKDLAENLQEEV